MNNEYFPWEITVCAVLSVASCSEYNVRQRERGTAGWGGVKAGRLTAVVHDQLLQTSELRARGDVEATAVQLPDLVVLHIQAFGVVIVQHRQTIGPCKKGQGG